MTPALEEPEQTEPAAIRALTAEAEPPPVRPFDRRFTRAAAALRQQANGASALEAERARLELIELEQSTSNGTERETNGLFRRPNESKNGVNGTNVESTSSATSEEGDLDEHEATTLTSTGEK
jgi:hypothetical protein